MFKHMVVYVARSTVFTDRRFTDKLHNTLRTHEEHGWELTSVAPRSGPLGDISGIWLFFKRSATAEELVAPSAEVPTAPDAAGKDEQAA